MYIIYKEKFNAISTNPVPSTSQKLRKTNNKLTMNTPRIISVPSTSHAVIKSNKKVNSLVYNYLVRNYHFDVAIEFMKLVGSLEDVRGGPLLEDMFTHYMQSMKSNAKVIADKEQYLKIVKLNDEYHDHIQNFQPKIGSQLDQVGLYLILQNLETYNFSVKLLWSQMSSHPVDYPWMSIRYFSNCKGGETEMMMKNYKELISNARVNNPTMFCNEISENLYPGPGKKMSENMKWKLIMIGVFLSRGLTKKRHAFDVLTRVMKDVKSLTFIKGEYSIEEDNTIIETVQNYGNNKETWKKLCVQLNRSRAVHIKERYENHLTQEIVKPPNRYWSMEEDKILIDCLFKYSSLKNPKYISSILLKNVRESKANEVINRSLKNIAAHFQKKLMPLLLQYHQGTINTPWKYSVLEYIYENKVMSATELKNHMTEINKSFPWLNISIVNTCYASDKYDVKEPLYEFAKSSMKKHKDKPAHTEKELKRCEEIIEYYDPNGELSEFRFCKVHQKCLKSHGCSSQ